MQKLSHTTRGSSTVSNLILIATIAFVGFVGWKSFITPPALQYTNVPFPVVEPDKVYVPGDQVDMYVERCNHTDVPVIYIITRSIVNTETKIEQLLPSTSLVFDPGCAKTVSHIHTIPLGTEPGEYTLKGTAIVPRLIGNDAVSFSSQPFKVGPAQ